MTLNLLWSGLTIPAAGTLNGSSNTNTRQLAVAGSRSCVPLTYGSDRVGALILNVLPATTGSTTLLVQCLWGFACDSVNDILLNNVALPTGATHTDYTGSQGSADSALVTAMAAQSITYSDTLAGYAYTVIAMPIAAFTGDLNFSARIKGRKVYDPRQDAARNLVKYSDQFGVAGTWTTFGSISVTSNATSAPDGTTTADTLTDSDSTNPTLLQNTCAPVPIGTTVTASIYLKAGTATQTTFNSYDGGNTENNFIVGWSGGVPSVQGFSGPAGAIYGIIDFGSGWYRLWVTWTTGFAGALYHRIWPCNRGTASQTGSIYAWGAQLEYGAIVGDYIATGATLGTQVERSAWNLIPYSEQLDNAAYWKGNLTVTANATAAPDGATTADKLVENTAASVNHTLGTNSITIAGGSYSAGSVYVKAAGRNKAWVMFGKYGSPYTRFGVTVDLTNGTFVTNDASSPLECTERAVESVGNGWYRVRLAGKFDTTSTDCTIEIRPHNGTSTTYTGDGSSGVYAWGMQLEANAKECGPYNPTDASISTQFVAASTWTWSDNPALCEADFLASTLYGLGSHVNYAKVAGAANYDDALVGGSEKRRILGISFQSPQSGVDIAETLRAHASCFLLPDDGNGIRLLTDQDASSIATYAHANGDIASISDLTLRDVGNSPTAVEVLYTNTDQVPWREMSAVAQLTGAGTSLPWRLSQVRMTGVQRYSQANREAIERLNKLTLTDLSCTLEVFDIGIRHEVGDIVTVTHPVGITSKPFRVNNVAMSSLGKWLLALVEHDPACYSATVASGPTIPNFGVAMTPTPSSSVNLLWGSQNGPLMIGAGTYGGSIAILKAGTNNPYNLQPGDCLTVSAEIWGDASSTSGDRSATIFLYSYDSGSVWHETATLSSKLTASGTRTQATVVLGVAANMDGVQIGFWHQGTNPSYLGVCYADKIQVERGFQATPYAPGYQPGATYGATWGTNVTGQPTSLSGINSTEGSKLTGIATGATKNTVTYSGSAPGSPSDGDIWVDNTRYPYLLYVRLGGAWSKSSDLALPGSSYSSSGSGDGAIVGSMSSGIRFNTNGTADSGVGETISYVTAEANWYPTTTTGIGSSYDITFNNGGTWYQISSAREVTVTRGYVNGTTVSQGNYQIRDHTSHSIISGGTYYLSADMSNC